MVAVGGPSSSFYNIITANHLEPMPNPFPILFQDRLSDEELAALKPYLQKSERGQPIAFEGRLDVRNFVEERIVQVRSGYAPEDCNTVIVEGAPGAGKSSLLRQIKQDTVDNVVNRDVIPLLFEVESLNNPVIFLQKLLSHQATDFDALSASYAKVDNNKVNLKLFEFGGGISHYFPSLADRIRNSPEEIWNAVRASLKGKIDPIFLLLIDEAQRIEPNKGDKNTLATNMHGATDIAGLKIIPVFAGLSDTGDRLEDIGITRSAGTDFKLRLLEPEEGLHVCRTTFSFLGIDKLFKSKDLEIASRRIYNASDGWPRHLHYYLRYFVNEVLENHKSGGNGVDLNHVLDLGHDNRIAYYQKRFQRVEYKWFGDLLNDVAKLDIEQCPITRDTFYKALRNENYNRESIDIFVKHYIHKGILDYNLDGSYEFPIPSLQTFLANDRDVVATKEELQDRLSVRTTPDSDGDPSGGRVTRKKGGRFD